MNEFRKPCQPQPPSPSAAPPTPHLQTHGLGSDTPSKPGRQTITSFAAQYKFSDPHPPNLIPNPASPHLPDSRLPAEVPQIVGEKGRGEALTLGLTSRQVAATSGVCGCLGCTCLGSGEWEAGELGPVGTREESGFVSSADCDSGSTSPIQRPTTPACQLSQLGPLFRELSARLVAVSALVARVCDFVLGGDSFLEKYLREAGTAKGRLIHYQAWRDPGEEGNSKHASCLIKHASCPNKPDRCRNKMVKERTGERRGNLKSYENPSAGSGLRSGGDDEEAAGEGCGSEVSAVDRPKWQEWHYDFGLFTALTSPLYSNACEESGHAPSEVGDNKAKTNPSNDRQESGIELSTFRGSYKTQEGARVVGDVIRNVGGNEGGLHVLDPVSGSSVAMEISLGCVGVQVGEAAQILSGGRLRAVAHCVTRGQDLEGSREVFVVFTQPHRDAVLSGSIGGDGENSCVEKDGRGNGFMNIELGEPHEGGGIGARCEENRPTKDERDVQKVVPFLEDRWKEGTTFAHFSKETTKQYYGTRRH